MGRSRLKKQNGALVGMLRQFFKIFTADVIPVNELRSDKIEAKVVNIEKRNGMASLICT
jgi:hypothetical protein